jgi:hypothetical protein
MGRRKTIRLIESIHSKGIFGPCSCGGEVLYYTDKGVRCSTCGKLYGVWTEKRHTLVQRAQELIAKSQQIVEGDQYIDLQKSSETEALKNNELRDQNTDGVELLEDSIYS